MVFSFLPKEYALYLKKWSRKSSDLATLLNKWWTQAYPFLIFVFCSFQIKNYIITGLVSIFLMHLVRGWHFLCRKEKTFRMQTFYLNSCKRSCPYKYSIYRHVFKQHWYSKTIKLKHLFHQSLSKYLLLQHSL